LEVGVREAQDVGLRWQMPRRTELLRADVDVADVLGNPMDGALASAPSPIETSTIDNYDAITYGTKPLVGDPRRPEDNAA
jgi:hypothetical protein